MVFFIFIKKKKKKSFIVIKKKLDLGGPIRDSVVRVQQRTFVVCHSPPMPLFPVMPLSNKGIKMPKKYTLKNITFELEDSLRKNYT